jgi:hypothetical protein
LWWHPRDAGSSPPPSHESGKEETNETGREWSSNIFCIQCEDEVKIDTVHESLELSYFFFFLVVEITWEGQLLWVERHVAIDSKGQ